MSRKQYFLVFPPSRNTARKQCFLVCTPLGNMVGNNVSWFVHLRETWLGNNVSWFAHLQKTWLGNNVSWFEHLRKFNLSLFFQPLCVAVSLCLHYFCLCVFTWMLVEGLQIYKKVVSIFSSSMNLICCHLIGWGNNLNLNL